MRVYIVAVDEPVYLVPYLRDVIEQCRAMIVGVAVLTPRAARVRPRRLVAMGLLATVILAPRQWVRLVAWKARDLAALAGLATTRHHLADVCRERGIPVRTIESANSEPFVAHVVETRVDVLLHQTPEILRGPILRAPAVAVINRHFSLLPAYRGAWPVFWQFVNGERRFGTTIHVIDEGLDTGPIVAQAALDRRPGDTMSVMLARLFEQSVPLTCEALSRLRDGAPLAPNATPDAVTYRTPRATDVLRYWFRRPARPRGVRP